jgi:hypothetical protein
MICLLDGARVGLPFSEMLRHRSGRAGAGRSPPTTPHAHKCLIGGAARQQSASSSLKAPGSHFARRGREADRGGGAVQGGKASCTLVSVRR